MSSKNLSSSYSVWQQSHFSWSSLQGLGWQQSQILSGESPSWHMKSVAFRCRCIDPHTVTHLCTGLQAYGRTGGDGKRWALWDKLRHCPNSLNLFVSLCRQGSPCCGIIVVWLASCNILRAGGLDLKVSLMQNSLPALFLSESKTFTNL